MKKLILASTSKYRAQLLSRIGQNFEQVPSQVDEEPFQKNIKDPTELAKVLSYEKAKSVFNKHTDSIVIGSDQVCHMGGKIFNKSGNLEKAFENLKLLNAKEHYLSTAYTIIDNNNCLTYVNVTKLKMRRFDEESIKKYLSLDNPVDCAGSYKLELRGIALFESIETDDYTAIIGLPLIRLSEDLMSFGVKLF